MAVTVQTMGVHYRWRLPDVLRAQLRLAHDLREDLVTLQLEYEETLKAIWSSYPLVAAAEETLQVAEAAAETAAQAVSTERLRQRTKRIVGPIADRLTAARVEVKRARQQRRDAIVAVRDHAADRIHQAATQLKTDHKRLYAQYCQQKGLYWATYNDVRNQHNTAVKLIKRARAAGRKSQLRHHRYDGTGSIAVQLRRQSHQPARTPIVLADPAGKYRNALVLPWIEPTRWQAMSRAQQRHRGRVTVRMRCGSQNGQPTWIEIPVQQHRMLDADADIIGARLTVTRTAGHLTARLSVTAKLPDPPEVDSGPVVAIHLGWRDTDNGTQVATWRSTSPLDIPMELRDQLIASPDATTGAVVVPHRITERITHSDELRSQRDLALDAVRAKLAAWLAEHGPVPHPTRPEATVESGDVARWRSPARFAALAQAWRVAPPPGGQDIAGVLESWRRSDRALWERQEHGRGKAVRHRNNLYRQIAAIFADQAGRIVVDDTSVSAIAAAPTDLPTEVATRIARRRVVAAPANLRAAITSAATREGVPVSVVPAAGLTRIHAHCGYQNPADGRHIARPVLCDGCGSSYDPDASATLLMLQRVNAYPAPATRTK
ncbi:hypothetical protein MKSMC1_29230 [Mycobacterium kansasii]|nr:hypothetical protein MKSMC1_29230 [Mycobacterium kansasii]